MALEIHLQSVRIQRQSDIPTEYYWGMMHDALIDVEEHRLAALDVLFRQKEQVEKAYNIRVNAKVFVIGDLVWKVILPMDRRDRVLGKWSPNWEGPFLVVQVFSNNAYEIEELTSEGRILRVNGKYLKKYRPMLQEIVIGKE